MWLLYFFIGIFIHFSLLTINTAKERNGIHHKSLRISAKNFFLFNVIFITIVISSLRLPVSDTVIYKSFFETISNTNSFITDIYFEPGYQIINKLTSLICNDFIFFLFTINFFIWICFASFLKRFSSNLIYSFWLLLFLGYFDQTFNLLRQYMAMAILLYSYKYVINRSLGKFIIMLFIAMSFHASAIIFIITYFTFNFKIKKNFSTIFIYLFLCVLLFYFSNFIFKLLELTPYAGYLTSKTWGVQEEVTKIAPMMNFLILFVIIICYWIYNRLNDKVSNSIFIIVIIGSLMTILSFRFTPIGRVASYFSIFSVILLTNTIAQIYNKRKRFLFYSFFFIIFLARYVIIAYFRPDWASVYPYKFFFQ